MSATEGFSYFNPVRFFELNPEAESFFYSLKRYDRIDIFDCLSKSKDVPGLKELKQYFVIDRPENFGGFVTKQLLSTSKGKYASRRDRSAEDERRSLEYVLSLVRASLRKIREEQSKYSDPHRELPGTDPDLRAAWLSDISSWDFRDKEIRGLESLEKQPYTLHLILEDQTNVFVNENPEFKMTMFDMEFRDLSSRFDSKNMLVGRLFAKDETDMPFIRQATKTTFCKKRIAVKRSVEIHEGSIVKATDIYVDSFTEDGPQITDPFLQDVYLKRRGDSSINQVIETIQRNQMDIVAHDFTKNIFVQGVAGSGKTMVLLQRLSDMVFMKKGFKQNEVIFIEPNVIFDKYFASYFKEQHLEALNRKTMAAYLMGLVARYNRQFLKKAYNLSDDKTKALPANPNSDKMLRLSIRLESSVCLDKDCEPEFRRIIYSPVLNRIIRETIQNHEKKMFKIAQKTQTEKNGDVVFYLQYLSSEDFGRLIGEFLRAISKETKIQEMPKSFDALEEATFPIPTCLAFALVRLLFEVYGPLDKQYQEKLIAVDECQDYNFRIFETIHVVEPDAVMNLFGDIAQDLGFHGAAWDKKQGIADQIENHIDFKFDKFNLLENYRNSDEILAFCKEQFGVKDIGYGVSTMQPEKIDARRLVALLSFHKALGDRNAIIYSGKYEENVQMVLRPLLNHFGMDDIALLDPIDAKGMEFDNVFVVGFYDMTFNERYVTCSRALNELYIVQTRVGEEQ